MNGQFSAGDIVNARPWFRGSEMDLQWGVIADDGEGEHALVWFPGLGGVLAGDSDDAPGAVQAIVAAKITPAGATIAGWGEHGIAVLAEALDRDPVRLSALAPLRRACREAGGH